MIGLLAIDKPVGPTSHDIVARVRRALDERRVGHTGTLDPLASGLLILCVGPATRLAEYLGGLPKRYEAVARLGETTNTDDPEGEITRSTDDWRELDEEAIHSAFTRQVGERLQVPPAFSAKRVAGERLYRKARRGEAVQPEPVPVTIHGLTVERIDGQEVHFQLECSAGTYVRSVARDAGEALGVGAHLVALRRTRIGDHDVSDAVPQDRIDDPDALKAALQPALAAVRHLPRIEVDDAGAAHLRHGSVLKDHDAAESGPLALVHDGRLLGIGEAVEAGIQPRKVLPHE